MKMECLGPTHYQARLGFPDKGLIVYDRWKVSAFAPIRRSDPEIKSKLFFASYGFISSLHIEEKKANLTERN